MRETIYKQLAEIFKAMKTVGGIKMPASQFAYVPDPDKPSTWKLPLYSRGKLDPDRIRAAAQAVTGKGFRGQRAQIPRKDLPKVKSKIRGAARRAGIPVPDSIKE